MLFQHCIVPAGYFTLEVSNVLTWTRLCPCQQKRYAYHNPQLHSQCVQCLPFLNIVRYDHVHANIHPAESNPHIENQGNLQTILQTISSIAKMIRNVIGCVYVLEQGPSYCVFTLEVWSPNFLLPKTKMNVHFLWTKYNFAKHWNPTLSTWEYRMHVFPIKLITRKPNHLLIKIFSVKVQFSYV